MPGVVFLFFPSLEVWLDALEQLMYGLQSTPAHMRPFFSNCSAELISSMKQARIKTVLNRASRNSLISKKVHRKSLTTISTKSNYLSAHAARARPVVGIKTKEVIII
jgi:hypothetical protein